MRALLGKAWPDKPEGDTSLALGDAMNRRSNFSLNALLSAIGAFVIVCLLTAGLCSALRRKMLA